MKILLLIGFVILIFMFPFVKCVVCNLPFVVYDGSIDLFTYIRYKMWNNIPEGSVLGKIRVYCGLFGKGKTLSCVLKVTNLYDKYNGLPVWDNNRKMFVEQRVVILSNVQLNGYPFINLKSLSQITQLCHYFYEYDKKHETYTALICLIDELSVQLNSRSFKDNIDPFFLNTLLTCRKYHLGIYGTAQRFNQIDALFRQVTQEVVECNKIWRLQGLKFYDAYDLENCTNPLLVQPISKDCLYIRNKHYSRYDTHAMVENLEKKQKEGDLMSEKEILEKIAPLFVGADTVTKYSKLARKRKPNHKKFSS